MLRWFMSEIEDNVEGKMPTWIFRGTDLAVSTGNPVVFILLQVSANADICWYGG